MLCQRGRYCASRPVPWPAGHWDPLHPVLLRPTTWRNLMEISPRQIAAAGFSYVDVMVTPVLAALDQGVAAHTNACSAGG